MINPAQARNFGATFCNFSRSQCQRPQPQLLQLRSKEPGASSCAPSRASTHLPLPPLRSAFGRYARSLRPCVVKHRTRTASSRPMTNVSTAVAAQTRKQPARTRRKQPDQPPGMRLSVRMRNAIAALESGAAKDQRSAAKRCKVSESQLSRVLNRSEIQAWLSQRRQQNLAVATLRASRKAIDLVDHNSGHVAFRMTEALLQTSGDLKSADGPRISINNTHMVGGMVVASGYAVDLRSPAEIEAGQMGQARDRDVSCSLPRSLDDASDLHAIEHEASK